MTLKEVRQTRRAGLLNVKRRTFKCAGRRNDHMLNYEQVFGNVSERRERKCCAVLMKHYCKVKRWTSDHSPNEFTECQTPRKTVCLHAFTKTLKSNISEAQNVQVDWVSIPESDFYDKNNMQEKVNVLLRLQEAMQEKLKMASYSEPIQFLTLVRDIRSRMHCSDYFNIFEYLHMKSK